MMAIPDSPNTRVELYLCAVYDSLAGNEQTIVLPEPITRVEEYWYGIASMLRA